MMIFLLLITRIISKKVEKEGSEELYPCIFDLASEVHILIRTLLLLERCTANDAPFHANLCTELCGLHAHPSITLRVQFSY